MYILTIHTYVDLTYRYSGLSALSNALLLLRDCPYPISVRHE